MNQSSKNRKMITLAHFYILTAHAMYAGLLVMILYLIFLCYKNFHARMEGSSLPIHWPIFGTTPELLRNSSRIHEFLTETLEQSGGTYFFKGPWFSNMDILITSDPSNVHYILIKNFPNFQKGPEFKKIFDILGDGIFSADGESWENQRRSIKSIMKHANFQELVATTSWKKVEIGLIPILDSVSEMGIKVDIQDLFQRFAFDCSCLLVLGHDPASLCNDLPDLPYEKAFADVEEAIMYRHLIPESFWKLQKLLRVGKENQLSKAKDNIDRFLSHSILMKHRGIDQNEEDFNMLTSYMGAFAEKGGEQSISNEFSRDFALNLITAGKDTVSSALTWFFWLLATNPAEYKKIQEEIMINLQVKEDGKWKFTNKDELENLVYLHCAICESLRLFPPAPFQNRAPTQLDILPSGHRINPNTKVVLSFYSMGRMESIWGKDCLEFKPERWISEQGSIKVEPSFKFAVFNAGPRSCLGKEMSFIQMKIVAAAIISRFHIRVAEGHPILPSTSILLHMKHGMKVNVSKYV